MVQQGEVTFDSAMTRLKKFVYRTRLRVKDFLVDFDKLRCGEISPAQFKSGLSMAGVDKQLSPAEIDALCQHYTVPKTGSMDIFSYREFLHELELIFTVPNLEKAPLAEVAPEPYELLDRQRFLRSCRDLGEENEAQLADMVGSMAQVCAKRGLLVKPFFDDAAKDDHSAKLFGHVTASQFRQCINVKLGLRVPEPKLDLLVAKFRHDDMPEMVNYIAFANTVAPPAFADQPPAATGTIAAAH